MADNLPILTTSERSLFKRCPQAWWWRYREGLYPRGDSPDALWFGIGVHEALAAWYKLGKKRGPHPAETFQKWVGDEMRDIKAALPVDAEWYDEPKYIDARELGVAMLEGYVQKYGKDDDWNVIAIERPFKVRISHNGRSVARFWSTWDGVYRSEIDGQIYLMEHKTASAISLGYLEIDDQGGSYFAVASTILRSEGVLGPDENIAGIMYNFLRKSMPDDRPEDELGQKLNMDGKVSKRQPADPFVRHILERSPREVRRQLERIGQEASIMNLMRTGDIAVTKTPTKHCPNTCEFFNMCQLHERGGRAWEEFSGHTFATKDPYDRYRKSSSA